VASGVPGSGGLVSVFKTSNRQRGEFLARALSAPQPKFITKSVPFDREWRLGYRNRSERLAAMQNGNGDYRGNNFFWIDKDLENSSVGYKSPIEYYSIPCLLLIVVMPWKQAEFPISLRSAA
jgi:hypothetical protein